MKLASLALFCIIGPVCLAQTQSLFLPPVNNAPAASAKFLYSSDFSGNKVDGYLVNATTGVIAPTSQGSVAAHSGPTRLTSDKGGYRLYVANATSKDLSAYFINRNDGSLTQVPRSPFPVAGVPQGVAVHPAGHFIYVTAENNYISAFALQSDGSLVPVPGSPFLTQTDPRTVLVDPTGRFLYVADLTSDHIDAYTISTTDGALTPIAGEPYTPVEIVNGSNQGCSLDGAAQDLAFDGTGNYLLAPGWCDGEVAIYKIDSSTGSLSNIKSSPYIDPLNGSPFAPGLTAIAVDPQNRWAYVYESWPDIIPDGDIATLSFSGQPQRTNEQCGDVIRTDPSGKFVYAIGNTSGSGVCGTSAGAILGYTVNQSNGALTPLPGSPFPSPTSDRGSDGLVVTP